MNAPFKVGVVEAALTISTTGLRNSGNYCFTSLVLSWDALTAAG